MARSGMRSWIRQVTACEPGGCGARPGQPCIAYVPKRGKTTGRPTSDVHAARWRAFRAQQRKRITEREEKAMTDENAAETAEWRAGPLPRPLLDNCWEIAEAGPAPWADADEPRASVNREVVALIARTAYEAGHDSAQPGDTAHKHRHAGPISAVSHGTGTDGTPWTFSLHRCRECGGSFAQRLEGSWTRADLERQP